MTINEIPKNERPYEKFLRMGAQNLTDSELLAIILKTGSSKCSAVELAGKLLSGRNQNLLNLYDFSLEELCAFPGIGKVKAIQLKAVAELSKRISNTGYERGQKFFSAGRIAGFYMEQMRHLKSEIVIAAFFDSQMHMLDNQIFANGSGNRAFFPVKAILKRAILSECINVVIVHNHPSGNPEPSEDDKKVTYQFDKAARIMDLKLIDHIIIGDQVYYSFNEHNLI